MGGWLTFANLQQYEIDSPGSAAYIASKRDTKNMLHPLRSAIIALALAFPAAASAEDYLGILKAPRATFDISAPSNPDPIQPFRSPGDLSSAFRGTGFALDATATLPVWRFSFYGRLGAYRGDPFSAYSTSLLPESSRAMRYRYGLGMRYDFTRSLGMSAELGHNSPTGAPLDIDADLFTLGLSYRF